MRRFVLTVLVFTLSIFLIGVRPVWAQTPDEATPSAQTEETVYPTTKSQYWRAEVIRIRDEGVEDIGGYTQPYQIVVVRLLSGDRQGSEQELEHKSPSLSQPGGKLEPGDKIIVVSLENPDNPEEPYLFIADHYRLPSIAWLGLSFLVLVVVLTGWRGLSAVTGLLLSIVALAWYVVPNIIAGSNPLLTILLAALVLSCVGIYLAHGFNKRSTLSLTSMLITIVLAGLAAAGFIEFGKLFGLGTEEALQLQLGSLNLNTRGLLLGGIIIGALGVLDDIVTAQTAVVEELVRANPKLDFQDVYQRGLNVGREHITSLVNTLALAYAGSSLPVMLAFTFYEQPLWVTLNSEFMMEEIVRTLIGSSALVLAVPISTLIAAQYFCKHGPITASDSGHHHHHH